jgi:hypothetical protein
MDQQELEIYRASREAQTRYVYFLLAGAAAAVAFGVNQTQGVALSASQWTLGVAIACWAVSFFAGIRYVLYGLSTLWANYSLLRVRRGGDPEIGTDPELIQAASEGILEAIASKSGPSGRWANAQLWLLFAGALFYLAWHVYEMYELRA